MSLNILNEYIKITSNEINEFVKIIFENQYVKKITNVFIKAFIDVKFYNFYEKDEKLSLKENYNNYIDKIKEKLKTKAKDDTDYIENLAAFFSYIYYLDKLTDKLDINEVCDKLEKLRAKLLNKKDSDFKSKIANTYRKYVKEKTYFILKFQTHDFKLKLTELSSIENVYRTRVDYFIRFPEIFSQTAVEKTFKSDIIREDILQVEYSLVCAEAIKDIIGSDFEKKYLVQFPVSLLKKQKKMQSILNIVNNPAIQEKMHLEITYADFAKNVNKIYELMRVGFKFACVIDESMTTDYQSLRQLKIFSYIIVDKNLKKFKEIMEQKIILKNIIVI